MFDDRIQKLSQKLKTRWFFLLIVVNFYIIKKSIYFLFTDIKI